MTVRMRQTLLLLVAAVTVTSLLVVLTNPEVLRDASAPDDPAQLGPWLADHPTDWLAASRLADASLDTESPRRLELWRASYAHAKHLAPRRINTDAGFVRAGLFHWYELNESDRGRVLQAAAPLMRDPQFFARTHVAMWQLTRDFQWLHANAPQTAEARHSLRNLAVAQGLFSEYRMLREALRSTRMKTFDAQRRTAEPRVLLTMLPERIDRSDEALVRGILEELDRKAFEPKQLQHGIEPLVDYAVRHDLQPLNGIGPLLAEPGALRDVTRARAALDLNDRAAASRIEMTSSTTNDVEWQPYYLDRARFEARRGDAPAANAYLVRAAAAGVNIPTLAAAIDVARILGKPQDEARLQAQLAGMNRTWSGICGADEVCSSARAFDYVRGRELQLTLAKSQSDRIPPYVEIYVDDARLAEGEIRDVRTFSIAVSPGLHEIEVRLVNPAMRNGAQRRVRLS